MARLPFYRSSIGLLVWSMAVCPTADAQSASNQPEPWRNWSNLSQLQSRQKVRVETVQPKRKLKGHFVSSDDSGITLELADGKSEVIAKTDVRKVLAERESMKNAALIGAAAGGIVFAVLMAKAGEDIVPSGKAMFVGIGAGIGALGGWGFGLLARNKLIYEAPKR